MAIGKPKLSPKSIRTLLEIGSKRAEEFYKYWHKADRKSLMFDFFKLLSVSKSFLNTSRKARYNIYCLHLNYSDVSDSISLFVTPKRTIVYDRVELPIEHVYNLIKFSQPPYFNVGFRSSASRAMIEKVTKILQDTDGKIALTIKKRWVDGNVYNFINQFMNRIYDFTCDAKFLDIDEPYSFPSFDRLSVGSIENSRQFARILHYKTKELKLAFSRNYSEIIETSVKNLSVKKLGLRFYTRKHNTAEKLVIHLLELCPNAKQLDVNVGFEEQMNSTDRIPNLLVAYGQRIKKWKARFANDLFHMSIKFELDLNVSGGDDTSWVQKVRKKPVFSGWDITVDSDDRTAMYLSDDKRNLTISVAVSFLSD